MHNSSDTEQLWPAVSGTPVEHAILACLGELDALAAEYLAEVRQLSGYPASAITDEEIVDTATASLELLLRLIGDLPVTQDLRIVSTETGRRRARQGIPIDSLLRAVRMDFRLIWRALRRHVPPESLVQFAEQVVPIWDAVEVHTTDIHAGYLAELAVMEREAEHERAFLLRRLFAAEENDPRLVGQVAEALRVDPRSRFLVAVSAADRHAELRRAAAAHGLDEQLHDIEGSSLILLECEPGQDAAPPWLLELPVGISPRADGLAGVSRMWRTARRLAAAVPENHEGAYSVRENWDAVAAASLGEFGRVLERSVLGPLDGCPPREAALLRETVAAVLREGTVSRAAQALYCHRNTVLNRLGRFKEVTGVDPLHPGDASIVRIALAVTAAAAGAGAGARSVSVVGVSDSAAGRERNGSRGAVSAAAR
ncbi:PucR family transcriptional regulator [Okibacterium fritillariae]|uniref:DNA-binding transcriptional regulator, PucR family n=1 Tax=Okibacterium fritillariae TaxID=123320 RepID=A0A1T5KV72_9MICO|nr:PucR family transcriptional regulator [Okibacterium fritillariae]SKC67597.1 DNA-binding transcriptional regulator, PucR family [Okibacterium fritillariae]